MSIKQKTLPNKQDYILFSQNPITVVRRKDQLDESQISIIVQIFVQQQNEHLRSIRIRLSQEKSFDFLYELEFNQQQYERIMNAQHINIKFTDFPNIFHTILGRLSTDESYRCILSDSQEIDDNLDEENTQFTPEKTISDKIPKEEEDINQEENHNDLEKIYLTIDQQLEFCSTSIISLPFNKCSIEKLHRISQARFNEALKKYNAAVASYNDYLKRVERQAPDLIALIPRDE